jgi:hypothetical protein
MQGSEYPQTMKAVKMDPEQAYFFQDGDAYDVEITDYP